MKQSLDDIATNWHNRTINLLNVWTNPENSEMKRLKAHMLWITMSQRMIYINRKLVELSTPIPRFEKGSN